MKKIYLIILMGALLALIVSGCTAFTKSGGSTAEEPQAPDRAVSEETSAGQQEGRLIIYSGRSEPLIQPVIDAFQQQNPKIEVLLKAGSNSELANALIEEKSNPQADVFITTELFTIQALAQQDVFQSYSPTGIENIPDDYVDPDHLWVGLTRRARVIMFNTELVSEDELPTSIFDLTDPKWRGEIAAAGSTNGSMQAQVAAMRQLMGENATGEWLQGLIDNEVTFFGGHTDVRKAVGAGEFTLGLVNHYYYYLQEAEGSPVGIIFPDQGEDQIGLITNAASAAIIQGAPNVEAAQAFLDFLLSNEGQELFAELNFEFPLLDGVALHPDVRSLTGIKIADVNVAEAASEYEAAFTIIEQVGLP